MLANVNKDHVTSKTRRTLFLIATFLIVPWVHISDIESYHTGGCGSVGGVLDFKSGDSTFESHCSQHVVVYLGKTLHRKLLPVYVFLFKCSMSFRRQSFQSMFPVLWSCSTRFFLFVFRLSFLPVDLLLVLCRVIIMLCSTILCFVTFLFMSLSCYLFFLYFVPALIFFSAFGSNCLQK